MNHELLFMVMKQWHALYVLLRSYDSVMLNQWLSNTVNIMQLFDYHQKEGTLLP